MIVNIEPVGVNYTVTRLEIRVIDFKLMDTTCTCEVAFMDDWKCVRVEKVDIPENIYAEWGADDSVIINYVLQQLNLIASEG